MQVLRSDHSTYRSTCIAEHVVRSGCGFLLVLRLTFPLDIHVKLTLAEEKILP
jgi:hypothetical protein